VRTTRGRVDEKGEREGRGGRKEGEEKERDNTSTTFGLLHVQM